MSPSSVITWTIERWVYINILTCATLNAHREEQKSVQTKYDTKIKHQSQHHRVEHFLDHIGKPTSISALKAVYIALKANETYNQVHLQNEYSHFSIF